MNTTNRVDLSTMREHFQRAPFIAELGMELDSASEGECATSLTVQPRHLQQHGFVHAGVQAAMADHTMGGAAFTAAAPGFTVMTAEIKLSLLRAGRGEKLLCRARVLKPGRQFSFVEAEVYCLSAGEERLISKASATMALVAV
jgi:uncharacterized protein (TIGR00369 family)